LAARTLTILLIEDCPDYAALVRQWLSQPDAEVEYVLNWTDSAADGCRRLARGGVDVILLDLNLSDTEGAATFATVRAQAPQVPTIILSADNEVSMALRLIQEGADNYLVKGACTVEALTRAIRYAVAKHHSSTRRQLLETTAAKNKVIAVGGGKGGVGVTTVACALATELRRTSGEAVLLADLDLHSGLAPFLMSVKPEYSILYAISNSERLDSRMWERIVVRSGEGVDVACSPGFAGPAEPLPGPFTDPLSQVLIAIKPMYRWIVLDIGRLNGSALKILALADDLVAITTTSIPALFETKRAIDALRASGLDTRVRLTVNRTDPSDMYPQKELQSIFGAGVSAILPSSGAELQDAYLQKKLPPRNSPFMREIAKLVQAVGGPAPIESRPQLLSLAERLLRWDKPQAEPAAK
jgi:Flp pilus assembly CpaE family ATPase